MRIENVNPKEEQAYMALVEMEKKKELWIKLYQEIKYGLGL